MIAASLKPVLYDYPVFRKDFRRLLRTLVAVLILQGYLLILGETGLISRIIPVATDFWFPKLQTVVNMLIALAAAAHFLAEERENGTDRFLFRLAATRKQIFQEKIAAGSCIVLLTLLAQFTWGLLMGPTIRDAFWIFDGHTEIVVTMLFTSAFAYLTGLALSLCFRRSIHVILAGMVPAVASTWLIQIPWAGLAPGAPYILFIVGAVGIPIVALVFGGTVSGHRLPHISWKIRPNLSLFAKETREKTFLYLVLGVVMVLAFLTREFYFFLTGLAFLIVTVVFGVSTYTQDEKYTAGSVLYHHPASRNRIFWTKFIQGLLAPVVPLAILVGVAISVREWDDNAAAISRLCSLGLWVLIAYCCGALFTHACPSQIYAALAGLFALILTAMLFLYLRVIPGAQTLATLHMTSGSDPSLGSLGPGDVPTLSVFVLPLFLVAAGLTLSAWRASTNRMLQTGSAFFRFIGVLRLFLVTLAVVTVLTRVGWRDLFYLITHIDLGTG